MKYSLKKSLFNPQTNTPTAMSFKHFRLSQSNFSPILFKIITLFLVLCSLPLTGSAQNYQGDEKEISRILQNIKNFSAAVVKGDHDLVASFYTEDAKIFPNNMGILKGRDTIAAYWRSPDGVNTTAHRVIPEEIKVLGEEAYDYGYYQGATLRKNGETVSWKGKYVIIWKKENNDWKIYLDIWNRIRD